MKKIIITVSILGVVGLLAGYVGYLVNADSDTTQLSQAITAGSLTVTAPTGVTFGSKAYSLSSQDSTGNTFSNVDPSDTRGSETDSWNIAATCADWTSTVGNMDYDGNGSTTGRLTINSASASCVSTAGEGNAGISVGATTAFSSTTATITIVSAASTYGDGTYDCDGWDLQQFIKASQPAGSYTTTLTVTIS